MSFDVGAIKGGINFDISEYAHGMLEAEAVAHVFPQIVIEFMEAPLLAFIETAKEAFAELGEIIGEVANHFKEINLQSIKTGLDPETFSTFAAAAKAAGVESGTFANSLELMQQRAAAALGGDSGAAKGFEQLGISVEKLKTIADDPKAMLATLADGMAALPTQGERVRVAMEAMGRGGKEMLPFLQMGSQGVDELADHLGNLGARVGPEETKLGAMWAKMGAEFGAMWEGIQTSLAAPVLQFLSDHMDEIMPKIESFAAMLKDGVSAAMTELMPLAQSLGGVLMSVGDVVGSVVMPLLQAAAPLLDLIAHVLRVIADTVTIALSGLGALVNGAVGLFTGDFSGVDSSMNRGEAAAGRLAGDFGVASPTVNVEAKINLDPREASSQIAAKLHPQIARGYNEIKRQMQSEISGDKVKRGMGGKK